MKIDVKDKNGKITEQIQLDPNVFGIVPNNEVIKQYIRVYMANQRQGTSSTKTRSEVSGSSKKPWQQKKLGRARVGTKRNPLWRHGGVAHGPSPKSWNLKMPKKMKRLSLLSALSLKTTKNKISIIDKINMKKPNTKEFVSILENFGLKGKTLLVLDENNTSLLKSSNNIKNLNVSLVDNLNTYEVLNTKNVLFMKKSLLKIQDKYGSIKAEVN